MNLEKVREIVNNSPRVVVAAKIELACVEAGLCDNYDGEFVLMPEPNAVNTLYWYSLVVQERVGRELNLNEMFIQWYTTKFHNAHTVYDQVTRNARASSCAAMWALRKRGILKVLLPKIGKLVYDHRKVRPSDYY